MILSLWACCFSEGIVSLEPTMKIIVVHVPDFVALCEVENDSVLFDLTRRSALRGVNYDYVMTDSPDERGSCL